MAAALAVLPTNDGAEPRVIQQFTSIFIVSRYGELWRVYDSAAPDGADRKMPSSGSNLPYRIFLALARKSEIRVHAFGPDANREIDPISLQAQLDDSTALK